jgi:hypothetical protein
LAVEPSHAKPTAVIRPRCRFCERFTPVPGGPRRRTPPKADASLVVVFAFVENVEARREAFVDAMRSAESPRARKAISDTFDWSPNRKHLERALSTDRPTRIENAYRAAYLENTLDADSLTAQEALMTIPAASPLWSMAGLSGTIRVAGRLDAHEELAYEALRQNPADDVTDT